MFPLYALNGKSYRNRHRIPRFEFDLTEAEDIQMLSTALPGLVGLGMRIPQSWLHQKTNIPVAKEGEVILGQLKSDQNPNSNDASTPPNKSHKV